MSAYGWSVLFWLGVIAGGVLLLTRRARRLEREDRQARDERWRAMHSPASTAEERGRDDHIGGAGWK